MPSKPCKKQGCPELVKDGGGYCQYHTELKKTREKKVADAFYLSVKWRRKRDFYIKRNRLCVMCLKDGKTQVANMVDHIKPIKQGGDMYDDNNLQSLCWQCHNRKTAQERN